MELLRIFAGGLPQDITEKELQGRFSKYGKVSDVEIKSKTDPTGQWFKTFGYINIETTRQSFQKCRSQLNNTTWRDGKITIQLAKQSTTDKFATERQEKLVSENHKESGEQKAAIPETLKGAVPGTVLPDNENWVVTRYQRVVPVMRVRSRDKKNVTKYDPSRHSHQLKRLDTGKNELDDNAGVACLTWDLGEESTQDVNTNYKKRVGDFKGMNGGSHKKTKPGRGAEDIIQKRAEEKMASDDLEIVPVDNENSDLASCKGAAEDSVINGMDLSRFDSDSDSEVVNNVKTVACVSKESRRSTSKSFIGNSLDAPKSQSTKSKSSVSHSQTATPDILNHEVPSTTLRVTSSLSSDESSNPASPTVSTSTSPPHKQDTSTDSSNSSSTESSDEGIKKPLKRKSFPGTAAILAEPIEPGNPSGNCTADLKSHSSVSPTSAIHKENRVKTTPPPASVQSLLETSKFPNSNLAGFAWDLGQLMSSSTLKKSDTPVTPDSLAFLFESAASILRSAATQSSNLNGEIQRAPNTPPGLDLSACDADSDFPSVNLQQESCTKSTDVLVTKQKRTSRKRATKKLDEAEHVESDKIPSISSTSPDSDSSRDDGKEQVKQSVQMSSSNQNKRSDDALSSSSGENQKSCSSSEGSHSDSDSVDKDANVGTFSKTDANRVAQSKSSSVVASKESPDYDESEPNESAINPNTALGTEISKTGDCPESSTKPARKKVKTKKSSTPKVICNAEKRNLSNQRRLEALSSKKNEFKSQQEAVQKALRNMDTSSNPNRIVFDSEGEEEPVAKKPKAASKGSTGNNKILFDESSEDEEEAEETYNKMFSVKAQFEGETGAKLLELQKSFNDDSRFKLTEKFLDEDSDASSEGGKDEESDSQHKEEHGGPDERRKNLEILQSIVGSKSVRLDHPTSSKTKAKKLADTPATVFRDLSSMQFDPTSASHDTLLKKADPSEVPKKAKKKAKKKEGVDPVVGGELAPEITKERFFEVGFDFGESKGEVDEGSKGMTFDFLANENTAKAEQASDDSERMVSGSDQEDIRAVKGNAVLAKYKNPFEKNEGVEDSDDEERDVDVERRAESKALQTKVPAAKNTVVDWFFFKSDDPRLEDGAKRFSNTLDDERLRQKWKEIRPKLVENYLAKSKRAVKKQRSSKASVIKKRFHAKEKTGTKRASNTKA